MEGRCQCGTIRFVTTVDKPEKIYVCHCLECRWQSASSYGLTAVFPAFDFPEESKKHIKVWSRMTFAGKQKDCYFCGVCGSRLYHHSPGQKKFTVKAGALVGLTREMMDTAVHIWAKRAITPIPVGSEHYDEEPPGDDGEP